MCTNYNETAYLKKLNLQRILLLRRKSYIDPFKKKKFPF